MSEFLKRFFARTPARTGHATGGARAAVGPDRLAVSHGAPLADRDLPRASIVILNWNGRHHLESCLETLSALHYPKDRYEVVMIDNASDDGSVEELRTRFKWVRLIENPKNVGFAAGCNQGARACADSPVLVFLNNDMRVEPRFLRELVSPLARGECDATTAKMLSWDGKHLNSAGGGMNFHGIGVQKGYNELPRPEFDVPRKTLFPCGGAMAIDTRVFEAIGGFDEEFFAYYEDVDLGWRMWVQGYECHYAPASVCYHHHSSTSRRLPAEMVRLLQIRNPLLACFKNYDEENLKRVLPAMLALAVRRMWTMSGITDDKSFRIEHANNPAAGVKRLFDRARERMHEQVELSRIAAADLIGINDLLGNWDHWMERRRAVQSLRKRGDAEVFELFLKSHWCIEGERGYRELQQGLEVFLGLDHLFPPDSIADPKH